MNIFEAILNRISNLFNYNSFSRKKTKEEQEPVFITLEEAKRDPAMVNEIYTQINSAQLTLGSGNNYVAGLKYNKHQYYILGTIQEWKFFFIKRDPVPNDGARARAGVRR